MKARALVLVSGGIDSTVALAWALRRFGRAASLAFDYPGRPAGERLAERRILDRMSVRERYRVPLPLLAPPRGNGVPEGYLPHRNLLFYANAFSLARSRGFTDLVGGHTREDGGHFEDAKPRYFRSLLRFARDGGGATPRLWLPLIRGDDAGSARRGIRLGLPIELTWSCYRDGERPCGRCAACKGREGALKRAADRPPRPPR